MQGYPPMGAQGYPPQQAPMLGPDAAKADAEVLRKAMKGMGTDDKTLIATICKRTNEQLQEVRAAFTAFCQHDLIEDIKSETSGNYERLLVGLVRSRAEFDAHECNKAMKGAGTDEDALIQTLIHRTPWEMEAIKAAYLHLYGKTLAHDIEGDTSGQTQKFFVALINSQRVERPADPAHLAADVEALYGAGQARLGTNEAKFIEILTTVGPMYLTALNEEYGRKHGDTLQRAVGKEFSGTLDKAMRALLMDHDEYYAALFQEAVDGAGTKEDWLIRVVVGRRHVLNGISKRFMARHGKSLHGRVESEASANFKKALLAVTEGF